MSISAGNYFTNFNYKVYGSNPFKDQDQRIGSLIEQISGHARKYSASISGTDSRRNIGDYMANVMGGQRRSLDEYVKRTAGAGIKRGGFQAQGTPALDSALRKSEMDTLAAGYSGRYRDAVKYDVDLRNRTEDAYSRDFQNIAGLLNTKYQYLAGSAQWQKSLGDTMRDDWRADVQYDRDAPARDFNLTQTKKQAELDNLLKAEKLRSERLTNKKNSESFRRENEDRNLWNRLLDKQSMVSKAGRTGAGWTWQDETLADHLGVRMGYQSALQRRLNISKK